MSEISAYFFDMDHTLINNDCDVSWKQFLVTQGLAPKECLKDVDRYFDAYNQGVLDFGEFIRFQLQEFRGRGAFEIQAWAQEHFQEVIHDKIYDDARKEVETALASGKPVSLLTATNVYVARPLADHLGIPHVLGTVPELLYDCFTGEMEGEYCGGEGKVAHAQRFCEDHDCELVQAKYYGDSISDVSILSACGHPVCVNPSDLLREQAEEHGWPVLSFK